jgi:hypothetical protein
MTPEALPVFLRLFWTVAIITAGIGLYLVVNRLILERARRRSLGLELIRPGAPGLLYFTTQTCAPCKTIQRPAIQRLHERLGERL